MNFLHQPLFQNVIQSLSWTLIHSLWQGLILAVLAGIVLMFTKKSRPALRYNLLATLLFVFVPLSGYTFWCELRHFMSISEDIETIQGLALKSGLDLHLFGTQLFSVSDQKDELLSVLKNFLNVNSVSIVVVWLLVFCLKSFKAASGFAYIHRLRNEGKQEVSEYWQWELRQLAQRIGVYERIEFISSRLIQVPIVTGFFQPMIIVPLGFLTNLPVAQVEAILLHELAHIKRADFLVNLLQSFVESLFFFNPAVLWLSSLIREEREHCCDDIAIAVIENKISFVNALVSFQEYNLSNSPEVVAFAGKRNHLLERIKRIIYSHNKQLNAMEKLFVTASVIAAGILSVAFSPSEKEIKKSTQLDHKIVVAVSEKTNRKLPKEETVYKIPQEQIQGKSEQVTDTLPGKDVQEKHRSRGMMNMSFTENGKEYRVVQDDDEIVYLKVDGKVISKEDMGQYKSVITEVVVKSEAAREESEIQRAKAEVERNRADQERRRADEQRRQADIQRDQADEQRKRSDQERERADADRKKAELSSYGSVEIRKQANEARADAEIQRRQADKSRAEADVFRKQAEVSRKEADVMREKYEKMQAELIGDLIREGIITDKNNLSYKLSKDELIVNGKKQPDSLHEKFRKRFIKEQNVEMVYNWSGRTGFTSTGLIYTR